MAKLVWYNTTRIQKLQAINPRHAECLSLLVIPWTTLEFFLGSMKRRQPCHGFWELVTVIRSFEVFGTPGTTYPWIYLGVILQLQQSNLARTPDFFFQQRRGLRFDLETPRSPQRHTWFALGHEAAKLRAGPQRHAEACIWTYNNKVRPLSLTTRWCWRFEPSASSGSQAQLAMQSSHYTLVFQNRAHPRFLVLPVMANPVSKPASWSGHHWKHEKAWMCSVMGDNLAAAIKVSCSIRHQPWCLNSITNSCWRCSTPSTSIGNWTQPPRLDAE